MDKKINIIQFLPYFPPHKGGLETHAQQWGKYWYLKGYGNVYNVISSIEQDITERNTITFEGHTLGYVQDSVENLIVPTLEIINNFPVYKFWSPEYKRVLKYLNTKDIDIVITRTRFFLTSFLGGVYARSKNIYWCHIEHGSGYVKLQSSFKNMISYIYDILLGRWIFKKADLLVGVSHACKEFIQTKFVKRSVEVIYRGVELPEINHDNELKKKFPGKVIVGFVGRLYKWKNVESIIQAYYDLDTTHTSRVQIVIVGDGEDLKRLKKQDIQNKIYFTGGKTAGEAVNIQDQFDIHIHSSSPGGGLATTLLQAIGLGKYIVATPYEGAKEVITHNRNGILLEDDSTIGIRNAIVGSLSEIGDRDKYAEKNKELFEASFNWNKNIIKYYKLFSGVKK